MSQELTIQIEVSLGELLDRITILEIKAECISDPDKLENINFELKRRLEVFDQVILTSTKIDRLRNELKSVNEELWEIEDKIRICEREKDFGPDFVQLARSVYITNDQRSLIKREIDKSFGSALIEEKSYEEYRKKG